MIGPDNPLFYWIVFGILFLASLIIVKGIQLSMQEKDLHYMRLRQAYIEHLRKREAEYEASQSTISEQED